MEYFDSREKVENYIKMVDGDDGRDLINILKKHLSPGSTVLELGMGPGKDLEILAETFSVTGSDISDYGRKCGKYIAGISDPGNIKCFIPGNQFLRYFDLLRHNIKNRKYFDQ